MGTAARAARGDANGTSEKRATLRGALALAAIGPRTLGNRPARSVRPRAGGIPRRGPSCTAAWPRAATRGARPV